MEALLTGFQGITLLFNFKVFSIGKGLNVIFLLVFVGDVGLLVLVCVLLRAVFVNVGGDGSS